VELKIGPFLWTAVHTAYEKNRLFADEQVQGPFAQWTHRHEFEALGDATRLTDRIEYRLKGGAFVNWALAWAVQLGLDQMFRARHQTTKRYCEKGAS
jgi:ligand-binding SRPBCC domain-containing protein